jgi:hypothetical protein
LPEYADRDVLWSAAEKTEKQINSQSSREIKIALPAELSKEQNISLARRYTGLHWIVPILTPDYTISAKCEIVISHPSMDSQASKSVHLIAKRYMRKSNSSAPGCAFASTTKAAAIPASASC